MQPQNGIVFDETNIFFFEMSVAIIFIFYTRSEMQGLSKKSDAAVGGAKVRRILGSGSDK